MRARLAIGSAFLCWAMAAATGIAWLQLLAGAALVYLVPGLAVLRVLRTRCDSALQCVLLAGTISPFALGLLAWLGTMSGRPVSQGGVAALVLCGAVALWPPAGGARIPPTAPGPGEQEDRPRRLAWLVTLGAGALAALGELNPWVRNWSDAWAHAAIFEEVLRGGIPPEFPHFAGHAMPYAWFFHVFLAGTSSVVSRDPLVLMAVLNVWTAMLLPLGVHELGRSVGLRPSECRWSAVAVMLGMNPAGWLWLVAQSTLGQTTDASFLSGSVSSTNLVLTSLSFRFPYFQATLFGRLWTPTAFMFAIMLSSVVVGALVSYWQRPTAKRAAAFLAFLALLFLWHPLTALQTSLGIAVAVPVAAVLALPEERRSAMGRGIVIAIAGAAAFTLALPYLRIATGGMAPGTMARLELSVDNLVGLLLSMGPVVVLAVLGLSRLDARRRWLVAGLLLGLAAVLLLVDVPGVAEEKFYLVLFIAAAALAGATLERWWGRALPWRAAVAAFVASGLLTTGLTAWAFVRDQRSPRELFATVRPGDPALVSRDEDLALRWLREHSPREAVVLQFPRPNGPEPILVLGRRRLYLGAAEALYLAAFMPRRDEPPVPLPTWRELKRREALQRAVFSDRALDPDSLAMLRSAGPPLIIWWDDSLGNGRLSPSLRPEAGATRAVLASPTVRLLELLPAP